MEGYTVGIRNNKTGEVRSCHYEFKFSGFWWSQNGNMGCDCNRELEFERAITDDFLNDLETECGEGGYDVVSIILDNGEDITNTVNELNYTKKG